LGSLNFVEYALCIRVEVKDLLNAFVGLVKHLDVPLLGDDTFIEDMLVDGAQLQVLYLEKDLDDKGLHDTVVNGLDIFLKLRLVVLAVDITSYLVSGMLIITGL
jgi:hypothetical protein